MNKYLKVTLGLAFGGGLVVLAGCVVTSVYPYYNSKDVVFDQALVGTWVVEGETNAAAKNWQFKQQSKDQAYTLVVQDGEERTEFTAHLFKLEGHRFLDALPLKREDDFIPPHYLLQVRRLHDSVLVMCIMDYRWLEELVEKDSTAIRHLWIDRESGGQEKGKLVLTANTAELQKFILKYAADTNAFSEPFKMNRQP